jgi:hypothetical protein
VLYGDGAFGDMYVDRKLLPRSAAGGGGGGAHLPGPSAGRGGVHQGGDLASAPPKGAPDGWTLLERAKASFDPERSGDFVVLLKPRVTPIYDTSRGYVSTHGSPWDYDRKVPILFWRKGMTPVRTAAGGGNGGHLPTLRS